jgi:hypothetical protein
MTGEILIRPHGPLLKLLEYYALACIGELPTEREAALRQRIEQTYRSGQDWKLTIHASAVFMVLAWLFMSGLLLLHFTVGVFARTTASHVFLAAFALSWLLIPVQVLRYYRTRR